MRSEVHNGKLFLEGKEIQIGEFIFLKEYTKREFRRKNGVL